MNLLLRRKCDSKCVYNLKQTLNRYLNSTLNPLVIELMPQMRQKSNPINGRKYSSLWFALKAIQNNSRLVLRNNSIVFNPNYRQMNGKRGSDQMFNNEINSSEPPMTGIKVIEMNANKALVSLSSEDIVYELSFGCIRVTLLSDNYDIDINGFTLTAEESIDLMAVFDHKISIKCRNNQKSMKSDFKTKLKTSENCQHLDQIVDQLSDNSCHILIEKLLLSSLLYLETVPTFRPSKLPTDSVWFQLRSTATNGYNETKVWDKLFNDLVVERNDIIIVSGGRNVGKSSLIRVFINKYLSEKQSKGMDSQCLYLDCDPGQSEFSNSAQISLTQIQKPIISSTPLNVLNYKPLVSCSVGATTPAKDPKIYISCLNHIMNYFKTDCSTKGPLFVNTMGWTQGLGLALLTDIIKTTFPTHVIQIDSTVDHKINFQFDLTPDSVNKYNGFHFGGTDSLKYKLSIIESNNKVTKRAQTTRHLQQLSYMSQMPDILFKPFHSMTPFKIYWCDVFVHIISDVHILSQLYLDVLNLSWIQLCRIDEQSLRFRGFNGLKIVDTIDANLCLGSAIIRGIDFENKCFYILSPESPEVLKSINCIIKPSGLQTPKNIVSEQLYSSFTSTLPYISDQ